MRNNVTKLALLFGIIATIGFGTIGAQAAEVSGGLGHITLVLADSEGIVKQYIQTDNTITNMGFDCLVDSLFIGSVSTAACLDITGFDTIAIGLGVTTNENAATALATGMPTDCRAATVTPTADAGTTTQRITIEAVFGGGGAGSGNIDNAACIGTIQEAVLANNGSATVLPTNIFAYQDFAPGISLGAADTLTVTWDIDFS